VKLNVPQTFVAAMAKSVVQAVMNVFTDDSCVTCRQKVDITGPRDSWVRLGHKGVVTLIEFSSLWQDSALYDFLGTNPSVVHVHVDCRKTYTNRRWYEQQKQKREDDADDAVLPHAKLLRSSGTSFDWKHHCFLCAAPVEFDSRHPDRCDSTSSVSTIEMHQNVAKTAAERNDQWGLQVQGRLQACNDLVAEEAVYHRTCLQAFHNKKTLGCGDGDKKVMESSQGVWKDETKMKAFNKFCEWLEVAEEQVMMRSVKSRGSLTHGRGTSESIRLVWVKSMHRCASIHAAIKSLTETDHSSDDVHHAESGRSRTDRDNDDLMKLTSFLDEHNPFAPADSRLRSISSGVVACSDDGL
jgi:hypothetical protein